MYNLKPLVWQTERIWSELFCGEKVVGFAKASSTEAARPFVWFNKCNRDNGFANSLNDAQTQAEDSFKNFVSEILV